MTDNLPFGDPIPAMAQVYCPSCEYPTLITLDRPNDGSYRMLGETPLRCINCDILFKVAPFDVIYRDRQD